MVYVAPYELASLPLLQPPPYPSFGSSYTGLLDAPLTCQALFCLRAFASVLSAKFYLPYLPTAGSLSSISTNVISSDRCSLPLSPSVLVKAPYSLGSIYHSPELICSFVGMFCVFHRQNVSSLKAEALSVSLAIDDRPSEVPNVWAPNKNLLDEFIQQLFLEPLQNTTCCSKFLTFFCERNRTQISALRDLAF